METHEGYLLSLSEKRLMEMLANSTDAQRHILKYPLVHNTQIILYALFHLDGIV